MLRPPPDRRSGYRVLLLTALAGAAACSTRVSARVGGRPDFTEDLRARSPFDRRAPAAVAGRPDAERPDTLRAGGAASRDAASLRAAMAPPPAQEAAWARADWRDSSSHREYTVEANGQRLHVLDWGGPTGPIPHGAAAPLVFLPGMSHTGHVFDGLAPRFTDRHRVIALTLRGHGASSAPARPYTVDSLAADVAAALPALGLRGAVLVGHSLGGHVANRAALRFPSVVGGVVYLDATKDTAGLAASRAMGPTRPAAPDSAWATRDRARTTYRRLYFPFWSDAQEADFRAQRTAPEVPAMTDLQAPGDWRAVRQPQLAVCALDAADLEFAWLAGAERRARRAEIARAVARGFVPWERASCARFAREAPRGTLAVVPESHHYVFLVSPEQTYETIRRWLDDAGTGANVNAEAARGRPAPRPPVPNAGHRP